jgi:outer membrane lipoprotein SlyB
MNTMNLTNSISRSSPRSFCTCRAGTATRGLRLVVTALLAAGALSLGACNNAGEGALSGAGLGAAGSAAIGAVSGALGGAVLGDQNERRSRGY